jgi:hypothetical protein
MRVTLKTLLSCLGEERDAQIWIATIIDNQEPVHITVSLQFHPSKLLTSYWEMNDCIMCWLIIKIF